MELRQPDTLPPSPDEYRPSRAEVVVVLGLLAVILAFNVWTYNWYPTVWTDEVLWSEPAINLVKTGHFTTSVWQLQPADTFWAAQSPLYCFALSGWLRFAGTSLLAVRSFNFVLVSFAAFLAWVTLWRYRLVATPLRRIFIVPLLLFGYGISFAYRSARPDMAGMVSLLGLLLAFSTSNRRRKDMLVFLSAAITPWVGMQVALFATVACVIAKLVFLRMRFRDLLIVATGIVAGGATLLAFFAAHGVLAYFLGSVSQGVSESFVHIDPKTHAAQIATFFESVPQRLKMTFQAYVSDFSGVPLLLGVLCLWLYSPAGFNKKAKPAMIYLLGLFFGVPLIFSFTGHFAFYYSYMIYAPAVVAFLMAWSEARTGFAAKSNVLSAAAFSGAMLLAVAEGLPLKLLLARSFCRLVPRQEYARIIQSQVQPADVVFADFTAFFEAKQAAQRVFAPVYAKHFIDFSSRSHEFSLEEKKSITVLIVRPEQFDGMKKYFGGEWAPVSGEFGDSFSLGNAPKIPLLGRRIESYFGAPQVYRHRLQIFRRVSD